jgi:hypothetical protein
MNWKWVFVGKGVTMRRSIVLVLVLSAVASAQWNPVPVVDPGELAVRGSLFTGELPLEVGGKGWELHEDLDLDVEGGVLSAEFGVVKGVSVFAGGGLISADAEGYDGSSGSWLAGVRGSVVLSDEWAIGCTVQVSGWEADDKVRFGEITATVNVDVVEVYVAPAVAWSWDRLTVYGGPCFLMVDGDLDMGVAYGDDYGHASFGLDEDESAGGFIGAQYEPMDDLLVFGEFRSIGETLVFGIAKVF